jgi:hypothetical protein
MIRWHDNIEMKEMNKIDEKFVEKRFDFDIVKAIDDPCVKLYNRNDIND